MTNLCLTMDCLCKLIPGNVRTQRKYSVDNRRLDLRPENRPAMTSAQPEPAMVPVTISSALVCKHDTEEGEGTRRIEAVPIPAKDPARNTWAPGASRTAG